MSAEPTIIRDPRVFQNDYTTRETRSPFELTDGGVCGNRNSSTTQHQTYSPYRSSLDSFDLNTVGDDCNDPIISWEYLYKYAEDIIGNRFLLFKNNVVETTLKSKRENVGTLVIQNADHETYTDFGDFLDISNVDVVEVHVFFDKIVVVTEDTLWFGDSKTGEFQTMGYNTHYNIAYHNSEVWVFADNVMGEYGVWRTKGGELIVVTQTTITDDITSSAMDIRQNRVEVVYTDSSVNQLLTFAEYDLYTSAWAGFTTETFAYEIIDGFRNANEWVVFYEQLTYPNWVGGVCVEFVLPVEVAEIETDPCPSKDPIYIAY